MRILHVGMSLDPRTGGGLAERTSQLSRALVKAGAECDVLVTDLGLTPGRLEAMGGVRTVPLPCLDERFFIPRFSPRQLRGLVRDADIVHLIGHWTVLNAIVWWYTRRLSTPYVVCPSGCLPIFGRSRLLKHAYNLIVGKRIIQNAAGHVAITARERELFARYGVDPTNVSVIPNGADQENAAPGPVAEFRQLVGVGDHRFILYLGRLNHGKGPDLLLRAFCRAQESMASHHLVFVGRDEGMQCELEEIADGEGVSGRVHFVGHLEGAWKAAAYQAAELLAVPSRHEAMSIVALEAGAAGIPVLLSDECGFEEAAEAGGGLVVPTTVEGIEAGLVEMLAGTTDLKAMGANMRRLVEERFTWDNAAAQYLSLFEGVAAAA